jgi:hypothetical protein
MGLRRLWALVLGLPLYSALARAVNARQSVQGEATPAAGPRRQSTMDEIAGFAGDALEVTG